MALSPGLTQNVHFYGRFHIFLDKSVNLKVVNRQKKREKH